MDAHQNPKDNTAATVEEARMSLETLYPFGPWEPGSLLPWRTDLSGPLAQLDEDEEEDEDLLDDEDEEEGLDEEDDEDYDEFEDEDWDEEEDEDEDLLGEDEDIDEEEDEFD